MLTNPCLKLQSTTSGQPVELDIDEVVVEIEVIGVVSHDSLDSHDWVVLTTSSSWDHVVELSNRLTVVSLMDKDDEVVDQVLFDTGVLDDDSDEFEVK